MYSLYHNMMLLLFTIDWLSSNDDRQMMRVCNLIDRITMNLNDYRRRIPNKRFIMYRCLLRLHHLSFVEQGKYFRISIKIENIHQSN